MRSPFQILLVGVSAAALALLGASCAVRPQTPAAVSAASIPVKDPGRPAQPEKPKPPQAPLAKLARAQVLVLATETKEGATRVSLQAPDGDRDPLIEDGAAVPHPVVAPDGSQLAYLRSSEDGVSDVALLDVKSRKTKAVEDVVYAGEDVTVTWNAQATRYVVQRIQGTAGDAHLLLFQYDGTGEQLLLPQDAAFSEVQSAFSPDGTRLAFRRVPSALAALQDADRISEGDLYVYALETGAAPLLLQHVQAFAWLDEARLAVLRSPSPSTGQAPLDVVSVNGGEPEQRVEDARSFAVSGDRSHIVYASGSSKKGYELTRIDVAGKEDPQLLSSFFDQQPLRQLPSLLSLSDDGHRAAVSLLSGSTVMGTRRAGPLLFVDFTERLVRRLAEKMFAPALSPDGEWVVYETEEASDASRAAGLSTFSTVWVRKTSGDVEPRRLTTEEDRVSHQAGWAVR